VIGAATETAFVTSVEIPANALINKVMYRLTIHLRQTSTGTPPTANFKLRKTNTAGLTLWDGGVLTPNSSTTNQPLVFQFTLQGTAAAGAAVNVFTAPVGAERYNSWNVGTPPTTQPVAVATNASTPLVLTLTYGASTASNSFTVDAMFLEKIVAP
jgi:hypothetical protein